MGRVFFFTILSPPWRAPEQDVAHILLVVIPVKLVPDLIGERESRYLSASPGFGELPSGLSLGSTKFTEVRVEDSRVVVDLYFNF
jgi:hypothetical protein